MTHDDPLDALPPQSRAVLALLLVHGRSSAEIAKLLDMDRVEVRRRAHAAAIGLVSPSLEQPPQVARYRIVDYLLGEQTLEERASTRLWLDDSPIEREWASLLAQALAPLAEDRLPSIPQTSEPHPRTHHPFGR